MGIDSIVSYWQTQVRTGSGHWMHPDDEPVFAAHPHTFNLDFPVSPYVGNIIEADAIILGANAGYSAIETPSEFAAIGAIDAYLARVSEPASADWSVVAPYYGKTNYGDLLAVGRVALVNACAYRSPRISAKTEKDNRVLVDQLPSVHMTRAWLINDVLPMAAAGRRMVIAKRPGLWSLPESVRSSPGLIVDPAPVSPLITGSAYTALRTWLDRPPQETKPRPIKQASGGKLLPTTKLTVEVVAENPHRPGSISWRAGQLVAAMSGSQVTSIIEALTALERDTTPRGVANPARWLSQFAGFESVASGKRIVPWIRIVNNGVIVTTSSEFYSLLQR